MIAVFTKLASQLDAEKFADLAIIPVIFVVQTLVSYFVALAVTKLFRFNKRASNFVTAMGVFGNSNSLPISLVLSLSQTLKGLHWDQIPGDNDDEVGARGILYLLIFQQLGQLVRWSWGYHVLLAPKDKYPEYQEQITEEGRYRDDAGEDHHDEQPSRVLIEGLDGDTEDEGDRHSDDSRNYEPAGRTPVAANSRASLADMADEDGSHHPKRHLPNIVTPLAGNHPILNGGDRDILSFPRIRNAADSGNGGFRGMVAKVQQTISARLKAVRGQMSEALGRLYDALPRPVQSVLSFLQLAWAKTSNFIWEFMNPPLWAMLIAVLVASIPTLQRLFFEDGSFVKNSVTSAIKSSGGVAVPLILVVLGANLARNTQATDNWDPEEDKIGTRLLIAALLCRMLLPTLIMAPFLALMAKFGAVSILDDPIFVIVCFLLTGAPSALQLAQICQINSVYEKTMGRVLFQSYVIW